MFKGFQAGSEPWAPIVLRDGSVVVVFESALYIYIYKYIHVSGIILHAGRAIITAITIAVVACNNALLKSITEF